MTSTSAVRYGSLRPRRRWVGPRRRRPQVDASTPRRWWRRRRRCHRQPLDAEPLGDDRLADLILNEYFSFSSFFFLFSFRPPAIDNWVVTEFFFYRVFVGCIDYSNRVARSHDIFLVRLFFYVFNCSSPCTEFYRVFLFMDRRDVLGWTWLFDWPCRVWVHRLELVVFTWALLSVLNWGLTGFALLFFHSFWFSLPTFRCRGPFLWRFAVIFPAPLFMASVAVFHLLIRVEDGMSICKKKNN